MRKIIQFLDKPLNENVCWALGHRPPCSVCWGCVGIVLNGLTLVLSLQYLLGP